MTDRYSFECPSYRGELRTDIHSTELNALDLSLMRWYRVPVDEVLNGLVCHTTSSSLPHPFLLCLYVSFPLSPFLCYLLRVRLLEPIVLSAL